MYSKRKHKKQTAKQSIEGRVPIYIPEKRLTVYPKPGENIEETRKRYLNM